MKKTTIVATLVVAALAIVAWNATAAPRGAYGSHGQYMQGQQSMWGPGNQSNRLWLPSSAVVSSTAIEKGVVLTVTATEEADVTGLREAYKTALASENVITGPAGNATVVSKEVDKGLELTVTSEDPATVQWLQLRGERIAQHVLHGVGFAPEMAGRRMAPGRMQGRMGLQGGMMNGLTAEQMQVIHNLPPEQRDTVMQGLMQNQNGPMMGRRGWGQGPVYNPSPDLEDDNRGN